MIEVLRNGGAKRKLELKTGIWLQTKDGMVTNYQIDTTLSRRGEGCGLGLSIVSHLVKAHAGTVNCDSRVNKGTTMTVTIPCIKVHE